MFPKSFRAALAAGCTLVAQAAAWAPIPAEVWAMKEDPAKGVVGAVVLEERMTFTGTAIRHVVRFRVLSERGKAVAELPLFLAESTGIEGRTVQPDGTSIVFDKAKDFGEKTTTLGDGDRPVKVLLPPGVTSNCVVEVRWSDLAAGQVDQEIPYTLGNSAEWRLGGRFPSREIVVEFWPQFHWAAHVNGGAVKNPEVVRDGRKTTYTFRDVPGQEDAPYALAALSGRPSVQVWTQPELTNYAAGDPQDYWREATRQFLKPWFWDRLKKGKAFAALATELLKDLPPEPAKGAMALMMRLDQRILNQSWPTLEEKARLKKNEGLDSIESWDLEAAAAKGRTNGAGMSRLFAALAEQAGLHPRLAFVKDRNFSLFHYEIPNVYQLQDFLVGIPLGPTDTMWLDPSLRFVSPGLILPAYQGVQGLVMDVGAWKPRPEVVNAQPSQFNQSVYHFLLEIAGEEEHIKAKTGFTGYPEMVERRKYLASSQEEADRSLKEAMEKRIADATVTLALVSGAWSSDQNAHWDFEAKREVAGGGTLRLDPFPGMGAPTWLPSSWPDHRTVPVVMHHLFTHDAESRVHLPAGYVLQPAPALEQQNSFGTVSWKVEVKTEGGAATATVKYHVDLQRLSAPAGAERELRQFLAWVEDGYRRMLVLEKP